MGLSDALKSFSAPAFFFTTTITCCIRSTFSCGRALQAFWGLLRRRARTFMLVELMNCFAAAASLSIVFYLTKVALRSVRVALCVTAGLALSRAFLLHATNFAAPMVAVVLSFLALAFAAVAFRNEARWPIIFSGFLFSL